MAIRPITPEQARPQKNALIPDEIIAIFNELILKNLSLSGTATIKLKEVISRLGGIGISEQTARENKWLDVEDLFREAGWKVTYDSPAYDENYDAFYRFEQPKKR